MSDAVSTFIEEGSADRHPGFKFPTVGTKLVGTIVEPPRMADVPKLDGSGQTERKLVIPVQSDDDGQTYSLFVKQNSLMLKAIGDAVKAATGKTTIEVGARFAIVFSEERDTGKPSKAKEFVAQYEPPKSSSIDVDSLL